MARVRFRLRWLMVAVAVISVILALVVGVVRLVRMPSNASEALAYVDAQFKPQGDYDVQVKRLRPGDSVGGQYGGVFAVRYIWRDENGNEVDRRLVLVMEGGYRLHMGSDPEGPGNGNGAK